MSSSSSSLDENNNGFHDQALIPYVPMHENHLYKVLRSLLRLSKSKARKEKKKTAHPSSVIVEEENDKNQQQQQQQQQQQSSEGSNNNSTIFIYEDIVPHILSYCDAKTLSCASCVCKSWNTMAQTNEFWENLCKFQFGISAYAIRPSPDPIKDLYILSHRRLMQAFYETSRGDLLGRDLSSLPRIIPALAAAASL